jgi:hypothetical protein
MITPILCKQGEFPPLDIEDLTEEQAVPYCVSKGNSPR